MKENQLLENKELRNENLGRIEVLDQVKELLLLGDTEFATTEMVAEYYGVDLETLKSCHKYNREELQSNGCFLRDKESLLRLNFNLKTKRGGFDILGENGEVLATGNNKGIVLFSKRAILNIGMLLRDSDVAKELRSRLLDVVQDAETETASIKAIVEEIDEEKQLMMDRIQAEMNGDFEEVCVINAKLFALKNKRIKELEDINEVIINHSTTIEDSRSVINRLLRMIATKTKVGFGKVYSDFYSKINYKLGVNLKARSKKPLDSMNEEEMYQAEEIARNWATKLGLDVKNALELN